MTAERDHTIIYPTLVIGLGGTGGRAVRHLKGAMARYFRSRGCSLPPIIRYLCIDTEDLRNRPGEAPLLLEEYVNLGSDFDANRVIEVMQQTTGLFESVREWWGDHDVGRIRVKNGAGQMRDVGRLSLFFGYQQLADKMMAALGALQNVTNQQVSQKILAQIGARPEMTPQVWIVGSLCGGTGAGIFLDVAYLTQDLMRGRSTFLPHGIFVLPQAFLPQLVGKVDLQRRVQANAYASLLELSELMTYPDRGKFEFYPDQRVRVATASVAGAAAGLEAEGHDAGRETARPAEALRIETRVGAGQRAGEGGGPWAAEPATTAYTNGHERHAALVRLRTPHPPFDRIFLVDRENEGSIVWTGLEGVCEMISEALLCNIIYRQEIEWEERNIYFTETYPGLPRGWRHFGSLGASSVVTLHNEEQDYYIPGTTRQLAHLMLDWSESAAPVNDRVVEQVSPDAVLAVLRSADFEERLAATRPAGVAGNDVETADRYREYLRHGARGLREAELGRLAEALPRRVEALGDVLERAIEETLWQVSRARGIAVAQEWLRHLVGAVERVRVELEIQAAEEGPRAREAARLRAVADDAIAQVDARRRSLASTARLRGAMLEYPIRGALWLWSRFRGRSTDLDGLYAAADVAMGREYVERAEKVCARAGAQLLAGLLSGKNRRIDRALFPRLERALERQADEVGALLGDLGEEIGGLERRLTALGADAEGDEARVVSDVLDAPNQDARARRLEEIHEIIRTDFVAPLRQRLLDGFGPAGSWRPEELRVLLGDLAVEVYVRWLLESTDQYAQDGVAPTQERLGLKLQQASALINYTKEARAEDLCPHLRRVFVADRPRFLARYGRAVDEQRFNRADVVSSRNPLRLDVYQSVYGLPASLLTYIEQYQRVYEELFTKAEHGQAAPLHLHADWNRRPTRPMAGMVG